MWKERLGRNPNFFPFVSMLLHPLSLLQFLSVASFAFAANWTANPFVPPAVPLAVKSPFLQAWAMQGTAEGSLNSGWETFRDGAIVAWLGILRVDGQSYVWMGDPQGKRAAVQKEMTFTSTKTIITMACGTMDLTATFLSPIEPTDLVNQSIPFSYLTVEVAPNDGNSHQVQLYTDVTGEWLLKANTPPTSDQLFDWQTVTGDTVSHQFSLQNQTQFLGVNDRVRYGTAMYSTKQVNGISYEVGPDTILRPGFIANGTLNNTVDSQFREISNTWPTFAFAHDLGTVSVEKSTPVVYNIGYVRDPLVQLLNVPNINSIRGAYYLTRYSSISDMVTALLNDYPNALVRATNFDNSLTSAAFAIASQDSGYRDILALSVRQLFGNIEITAGYDGSTHVPTDIMAFMSDGSVNSVDIIYSAWPAFLYTNPAIGRYLLEPVLAYQVANPVQDGYAIHDLGTASSYPNVTGLTSTSYPVEECGNQLIMALSYTKTTSDNSLITKYQSLYGQFATYLTQNGLYTASQFSSDSFNGQLANQTNLAVKSIVALKAASEIFQILGNNEKSQQYNNAATSFLSQWQTAALSSDKSHYTLSYGDNGSWGLLYNLFADRLLGFNMFPQSVYDTQTKWYAKKLADFGIPLDSRSTDAKTDWQLWTAATVTDQTIRTTMIDLVNKFASSRINNRPFPDRYNSTSGQTGTGFYDRSVVGGHFALLFAPQIQGGTNSSGSNGGKSGNNGGVIGVPILPMALAVFTGFVYALF